MRKALLCQRGRRATTGSVNTEPYWRRTFHRPSRWTARSSLRSCRSLPLVGNGRGRFGETRGVPASFRREMRTYTYIAFGNVCRAPCGTVADFVRDGASPIPRDTIRLLREPLQRRNAWISFTARLRSSRGTRDVPLSPRLRTSVRRGRKTRGTAPPTTTPGSVTWCTPRSCCPSTRRRNTPTAMCCGTAWNGAKRNAMHSWPAQWSWRFLLS